MLTVSLIVRKKGGAHFKVRVFSPNKGTVPWESFPYLLLPSGSSFNISLKFSFLATYSFLDGFLVETESLVLKVDFCDEFWFCFVTFNFGFLYTFFYFFRIFLVCFFLYKTIILFIGLHQKSEL